MRLIEKKTRKMLQVEEKFGAPIEELLRVRYVDRQMSLQDISDELSIGYTVAHEWLRKANIRSRGLGLHE